MMFSTKFLSRGSFPITHFLYEQTGRNTIALSARTIKKKEKSLPSFAISDLTCSTRISLSISETGPHSAISELNNEAEIIRGTCIVIAKCTLSVYITI